MKYFWQIIDESADGGFVRINAQAFTVADSDLEAISRITELIADDAEFKQMLNPVLYVCELTKPIHRIQLNPEVIEPI